MANDNFYLSIRGYKLSKLKAAGGLFWCNAVTVPLKGVKTFDSI